MVTDRMRLSARARKRLTALADAADIETSFLLEYLINRYGKEAIDVLSGQQGKLVQVNDTNLPSESRLTTLAPLTFTHGSLSSTNDPYLDNTAQVLTPKGHAESRTDQLPACATEGMSSQQQNYAKWLETDA